MLTKKRDIYFSYIPRGPEERNVDSDRTYTKLNYSYCIITAGVEKVPECGLEV